MELHLPDVANALNIIDAAASRGAFQGKELSQVGQVRDRLEAWVQANAPAPEDVEPPTPPETESEDTAETVEVEG